MSSKKTGKQDIDGEATGLQNTGGKDLKKPSELVSEHGVSELEGRQKNDAGRQSGLWDPHAVSELRE
jgi:hypothetical protein